jgi:hypothetical protein
MWRLMEKKARHSRITAAVRNPFFRFQHALHHRHLLMPALDYIVDSNGWAAIRFCWGQNPAAVFDRVMIG